MRRLGRLVAGVLNRWHVQIANHEKLWVTAATIASTGLGMDCPTEGSRSGKLDHEGVLLNSNRSAHSTYKQETCHTHVHWFMQTTSSLLANTCNTSQRRALLPHLRRPTFASQTKIHQVLLTTNLRVAKYSQNHYTEYLAWNNMEKITNSSRYWHRTDSWMLSPCSPSVRSCRRLPVWRNAHQTVNSTTQNICSLNSPISKAKHNIYAQQR